MKMNGMNIFQNFASTPHLKILNNPVLVSEAKDLPFKRNYFDKVFAYSVFHYFPDKRYAKKAVLEMLRVAKEAVFIGDLPIRSHDENHLLFSPVEFGGKQVPCLNTRKDRFNVVIKK